MDYKYIPFYVQGNAISGMYYGQLRMENDRDLEYVREMYPSTFARLQELVDKECDRQEFIGSMMFDEYPDKMSVLRIVNNIFDLIKKDNTGQEEEEDKITYPNDQWLKDIITVLLLNEMYIRRGRKKKHYYMGR